MHADFHRLDFRRFFIDQICRVDKNGRQHTTARAFGDALRNVLHPYFYPFTRETNRGAVGQKGILCGVHRTVYISYTWNDVKS
jgi:hypothetical protein